MAPQVPAYVSQGPHLTSSPAIAQENSQTENVKNLKMQKFAVNQAQMKFTNNLAQMPNPSMHKGSPYANAGDEEPLPPVQTQQRRCAAGHLMQRTATNPYGNEAVECDVCSKKIYVEGGFYHCTNSGCESDYHIACAPA
jgi:hypothetical protein